MGRRKLLICSKTLLDVVLVSLLLTLNTFCSFGKTFMLLWLRNCWLERGSKPAKIYLFKFNNGTTKERCEICSKITKVNDVVLVFLLLTLNIFHTFFLCFYWWLWTSKCYWELFSKLRISISDVLYWFHFLRYTNVNTANFVHIFLLVMKF